MDTCPDGTAQEEQIIEEYYSNKPMICKFLISFAWLSFIGGVVGGIIFFNNVRPGIVYPDMNVPSPLITPGIICIISGAVTAVLFWAISEIILYLDSINTNIANLYKTED